MQSCDRILFDIPYNNCCIIKWRELRFHTACCLRVWRALFVINQHHTLQHKTTVRSLAHICHDIRNFCYFNSVCLQQQAPAWLLYIVYLLRLCMCALNVTGCSSALRRSTTASGDAVSVSRPRDSRRRQAWKQQAVRCPRRADCASATSQSDNWRRRRFRRLVRSTRVDLHRGERCRQRASTAGDTAADDEKCTRPSIACRTETKRQLSLSGVITVIDIDT